MSPMDYAVTVPDDLSTLAPDDAYALVAELDAHLAAVMQAKQRVSAVAYAPVQVAVQQQAYHEAVDGTEPDPAVAEPGDYPPYRHPSGAHAAYPAGRIIRWDEKLYRAVRTGVAHSPTEAPEEWQRVWIIDGALSVTPPPDPDTGQPDWPDWDADTAYRRGDEAVMVVHAGRLWELIHTNAEAGWEPGAAGMHAVWADRGPAGGGDDA